MDPLLGWVSKNRNCLKMKITNMMNLLNQNRKLSPKEPNFFLTIKTSRIKVGPSVGFALRRRTGAQTPEQRVRPGATIFRQIGFLPFPKKYSIFNPRNFPQPISIINSCSNSFLYLSCIFHSPFH